MRIKTLVALQVWILESDQVTWKRSIGKVSRKVQVLFQWNDLESLRPTNAVKICAMNVQIGLLQQTITWCKIRHLNWYMVSEFFKSLSKAFQSLKPMVTGPLFTPVPFKWWKSKGLITWAGLARLAGLLRCGLARLSCNRELDFWCV